MSGTIPQTQTTHIGGFVMGSNQTESAPMSIQKIAGVDTYLVQYTDEEGKSQVRMAFVVPMEGAEDPVFVLNEKVSGRRIATSTAKWFSESMRQMVATAGAEDKEVESL